MFLFFQRFTKETDDAVSRGEATSLWTGRPLGRYRWSVGPHPFVRDQPGRILGNGWRPLNRNRGR